MTQLLFYLANCGTWVAADDRYVILEWLNSVKLMSR